MQVTASLSVVVLVSGATSYGGAGDPRPACLSRLAAAATRGWADVSARHVADFRRQMGRTKLTLRDAPETRGGGFPASRVAEATGARVERLAQPCGANGTKDDVVVSPQLLALAFGYARYLLASSSRKGGLPANLQGVWAAGLKAPWNGDYHLNINLQMTYWAAFSANLAESAEPALAFLEALAASGEETARDWYGANRGWVAHGYTDVWRDARALGENKWALCATCGAWAALALYEASEHAPGDAARLDAAAKVLGGALDFFAYYLAPVAAADAAAFGLPAADVLLSGPTTSPENSFRLNASLRSAPRRRRLLAEGGVRGEAKPPPKAAAPPKRPAYDWGFLALSPAVDVAILHRVATSYGEACARGAATCADEARRFAGELLTKLPFGGRPVARDDGLLAEYPVSLPGRGAASAPDRAHRHFSGLFALYPGRQLSPLDDVDGAAAAAARTLDAKLDAGGGHTGWSRAWAAALAARPQY